ncbi:MAG: Copper-sensing two-component system response regulator CpxR [Ignavibacteriae bacterium]|nr:MAG: Copper-sensing two-component system response regulator CpxR [Ignavibacteriota bacterium]
MNKKILFVDDDEALRILVKSQLITEGFEVDTADDGDTALEMIKKSNYDLILLDIKMQRLDGIETLKKLREYGCRARVIMLTAVTELNTAINSIKLGANDYITKPYEIEDLINCINRVLSR